MAPKCTKISIMLCWGTLETINWDYKPFRKQGHFLIDLYRIGLLIATSGPLLAVRKNAVSRHLCVGFTFQTPKLRPLIILSVIWSGASVQCSTMLMKPCWAALFRLQDAAVQYFSNLTWCCRNCKNDRPPLLTGSQEIGKNDWIRGMSK